MVAATNIKQGQLIIKEPPILLCPQLGGPLVCFNCCAQIKKTAILPRLCYRHTMHPDLQR
jgi:hypothetical protein